MGLPVLGHSLQQWFQPTLLAFTVGVHKHQDLSCSSGSTQRTTPRDPQALGAADQSHPIQMRHVLTQHALQVTCEVNGDEYIGMRSTLVKAGWMLTAGGNSPWWLRSSTNRTSCRYCPGAVSSTLCTVRRSVDQASSWKQITTLADGSDSLYCSPKHLKQIHTDKAQKLFQLGTRFNNPK